jgi:FKBP-type peptidyl-prolyl cis-trans isomerase FkpA
MSYNLIFNNMSNGLFYYLTWMCVAALFVMPGCKDGESQADIDEKIIVKYLADRNLEAVRHSSGLYYHIHNRGTGNYPSLFSVVTVRYKGFLTDGDVFDQTADQNTYSNYLSSLIVGWQVGIRLIKPGGKITLYVPSALGYGARGAGSIPPNSVLIFDVELVSFSNS